MVQNEMGLYPKDICEYRRVCLSVFCSPPRPVSDSELLPTTSPPGWMRCSFVSALSHFGLLQKSPLVLSHSLRRCGLIRVISKHFQAILTPVAVFIQILILCNLSLKRALLG